MRNHDLRHTGRLAVVITHRHLTLGIRTQHRLLAGMPRLRDETEDLVTVVDRRRHQLRGLAAGIAEHDALVAGTFVLVAAAVDALRNVGGLWVQQHLDVAFVPVETGLLIADVLDRQACTCATQSLVIVLGPRVSPAITTWLVVAIVSHATLSCRDRRPPLDLRERTSPRSRRRCDRRPCRDGPPRPTRS